MPWIDGRVKTALDVLFPMRCMLCGAVDASGLCPACSASLPRLVNPCVQCGAPIGAPAGRTRCGRCRSTPPAFEATVAPFIYGPPLSGIIHQLKYRRRIALARPLATLLAGQVLAADKDLPELLVPVPMHWTRLIRRGFNQSLELCRHLSRELRIPFARCLVSKRIRTLPQAALPLRARKRNLRGAFTVRTPFSAASVAIVDDVITSGETLRQVASALRGAGAEDIRCWAVLRTYSNQRAATCGAADFSEIVPCSLMDQRQ
jgi:ComF family protein